MASSITSVTAMVGETLELEGGGRKLRGRATLYVSSFGLGTLGAAAQLGVGTPQPCVNLGRGPPASGNVCCRRPQHQSAAEADSHGSSCQSCQQVTRACDGKASRSPEMSMGSAPSRAPDVSAPLSPGWRRTRIGRQSPAGACEYPGTGPDAHHF